MAVIGVVGVACVLDLDGPQISPFVVLGLTPYQADRLLRSRSCLTTHPMAQLVTSQSSAMTYRPFRRPAAVSPSIPRGSSCRIASTPFSVESISGQNTIARSNSSGRSSEHRKPLADLDQRTGSRRAAAVRWNRRRSDGRLWRNSEALAGPLSGPLITPRWTDLPGWT
jgi:hypothetical protein